MKHLKSLFDVIKADLQKPEFVLALFDEGLKDPETSAFLIHLSDVIKANGGMTKVAEACGINRESLYKSLSGQHKTSFATVMRILDVLGYRFTVIEKTAQEHTQEEAQ